jgi:hypothetical protein
MKIKVSNAQIEVWEWKAKANERLSNVPETEKIAAIKEHVKEAKEWILNRKKELESEDKPDNV